MRLLIVLLVCLICAAVLPAQGPIIRSIKFMNFEPVSTNEIRQALKDKDIKLAVERAYDPRDVDAAQSVLERLLADKGKTGVRVKVATSAIPPNSLEIVFSAVSN